MSSTGADYQHPALDAVATILAGLDELAEASLWSLSTAEVGRLVVAVERIGRRLAATQVGVLAQADSCGVADQTGASSTAVWLHNVADLPVGVGRARLALHHALTSRPVVAAAFSSGDIGPEAASAVCAAIDTLPGGVPAAMYTEIETLLVDTARDEGTKAVVARSMEIANRFDPDGFAQHEEDARARRFLHLIRQHDGTLKVRGCLDKEAGALVLAVLDPLAAPEPVNEGIRDLRLAEHRYADALVQLCQLATPTLPEVRGERPHMFVTTTLESLQHATAAALGTLEGGYLISPSALRRIACDANIIPVVLGSASQPLDIGRATRIVPQGLRRALILRDGGCAFPRLRPPTVVVRRPPHRPLGQRRTHLDMQHRAAVRPPPRPGPPRRLDHHHHRRPPLVHPTNLARPRPTTPTKQPLPHPQTRPVGGVGWSYGARWSSA